MNARLPYIALGTLIVVCAGVVAVGVVNAFGDRRWGLVAGGVLLFLVYVVFAAVAFRMKPSKPKPSQSIPYYSLNASRMGYGIPPAGIQVENVPAGGRVVKIRARPSAFIVVYVRRGASFEAWYCDYTEHTPPKLWLTTRAGVNERP